ncbi:MAG: zinc-binding dehydrogenase [Actinomycetota bacterium]
MLRRHGSRSRPQHGAGPRGCLGADRRPGRGRPVRRHGRRPGGSVTDRRGGSEPREAAAASHAGATECVLATEDVDETLRAIRGSAGDGPSFAFETAGLASTAELCLRSLAVGGTAVLVGLPPFGARASIELFPFVDGSRRVVGSNYGWSVPERDFPLLAEHYLAGRLPLDLLVEERITLDEVQQAMDSLRRGEGIRRIVLFP